LKLLACSLLLASTSTGGGQWRWPKMFRLALLYGISKAANYASN
jgi:hypothetical protein